MSKRSRALRYYRSYKPQGPIKKSIRFVLKLIIAVFLFYLLLHTFFFQSYRVRTTGEAEQPLYAGRILATPLLYGPQVNVIDYRLPTLQSPKRGDVVIVQAGNPPQLAWYAVTLNTLARFFTFHKFVPFEENEFSDVSRYQVMRVIGMPGDEIRMSEFRIKIKTANSSYFIDEQEVIQTDYKLVLPQLSAAVSTESDSLAGGHAQMELSRGEYLLAPDDRSRFGLSKYWQPSQINDINAKALFVYWPQFTFL